MKEITMKCYTKANYIVVDSIGLHAIIRLLELLYNDKAKIEKCKMKVDYKKHTIEIKEQEYTYKFENVPITWNGGIDTSILFKELNRLHQ